MAITHPKAAQWQYDERLSHPQRLMLSALKASICVVSQAVELVNEHYKDVDPGTKEQMHKQRHYDWVSKDEIYLMYFQDLKSDVKDFGETQLFKLMRGMEVVKKTTRFTKDGETIIEEERYMTPPDKTAVIFFNKTQNKDRGYVERHELTTPEGIRVDGMAPIVVNIK